MGTTLIKQIILGVGEVEEAPIDGNIYGRSNGDWVPVGTATGEGITHSYVLRSGTGIQTEYNIPILTNDDILFVYFDGVYQFHNTYTRSGTVITFSEAPPEGIQNIEFVVISGSNGSGSGTDTYTNTNQTEISVGGIDIGRTFLNRTMTQMWDDLLYPELYPTLTAPSSTFNLAQSGFREIGETVATLNFSSTFNRGSIDPAYNTSGFRSGEPNEYIYTGTGLTNTATTILSDTKTISNYTVLSGTQSWTGQVAYSEGEQPLSSKGNGFDAPLAAGTTNIVTRTITGVYPFFATTSNILTLTKQPLVSMTSIFVQVDMVAEAGTDKQIIEFPDEWAAITGIQFFNTVSGNWEWLAGSKTNSLLTFTQSTTTNEVQGNIINYTRFTHNGSLIGARQLRFYTN